MNTLISQEVLAIHYKWKSEIFEQQLLSITEAFFNKQKDFDNLKKEFDILNEKYLTKEDVKNGSTT